MNEQIDVYEISGDLVFYDIVLNDGDTLRYPFMFFADGASQEEAEDSVRSIFAEFRKPEGVGYVAVEIHKTTFLHEIQTPVPESIYTALPEDTGRILAPVVCRRSGRTRRRGR